MNLKKLKQAEEQFLSRYPGGFNHPEMLDAGRKHQMEKMIALAQSSFARRNFRLPDLIAENMLKIVTRSSLVSVFEKPKFRNFVYSLTPRDRDVLTCGLEELFHGNEQKGFEAVAESLKKGKMARWSLMTVCQAYYRPHVEVFIKPTTAKEVIEFFEVKDLQYRPAPTWVFYDKYRMLINEMKSRVDTSLSPNNAAFSGFLMTSMHGRAP